MATSKSWQDYKTIQNYVTPWESVQEQKCSSGAGKIPWRNFATEPMKLPDKTSTSDGKIVFGESLPYMACVNGSSMVRDYHPTDMSRLVRDHIVNAYHHHGIQVGGYVPSQLPGTDRIQTSSDLP
mmetsp:Transcript_5952/g.11690  ORF Transcript_5952/g.11690 Transcript_5952/m.11690 type:complete len:125 (-) Transcript_5952:55-429(-)